MDKLESIEISGVRFRLIPVDDTKVGAGYVMDKLGVSRSALNKSPWHLPDFGESLKHTKGAKPYTATEIDMWLEKPASMRKRLYLEWRNNETDKQNRTAGNTGKSC